MKLTDHFDSAEFRCQHCGDHGIRMELVRALEELRQKLGRPIRITSGYRCPQHPIEARKQRPGMHAHGIAADIAVHGLSARELYAWVITMPDFRGVGVDDQRGYVHVDIRPEPARWCYQGGKVVPWFEPRQEVTWPA